MLAAELYDICRVLFTRVDVDEYKSGMSRVSAVLPFCNGFDGVAVPAVPDYADYRHFFNLVLTPGIPGALPPVESLYREWGGQRAGLQQGKGFYLGQSAQDVRALCARLEIEIPASFEAMPDHLLLLLELHAFLCEYAPAEQARAFAETHFTWLADYRHAIEAHARHCADDRIEDAAVWYCFVLGLVEKSVLEECASEENRCVAQSA